MGNLLGYTYDDTLIVTLEMMRALQTTPTIEVRDVSSDAYLLDAFLLCDGNTSVTHVNVSALIAAQVHVAS